jgi:hypothetical protein
LLGKLGAGPDLLTKQGVVVCMLQLTANLRIDWLW